MNVSSELWLIAGPNGAGKTTLTQRGPFAKNLTDCVFLNADDQTLQQIRQLGFEGFHDVPPDILEASFRAAANAVFDELIERLNDGQAVCIETVLSTEKFKPVVEELRNSGGHFAMIYVGLNSPQLSAERIAKRVRHGGHDVPADRVSARWKRSIELLPWFAERANELFVFDNSSSDRNRHVLIATGDEGRIAFHNRDAIPEITAALSQLEAKE